MKGLLPAGLLTCSLMTAQPLTQRIGHTDPSKFNVSKPVHFGAGELHYMLLLPRDAVFNLNFMHRGIILPKSGIGHHVHNNAEEMFLIWGGQAQFTIDGRTSQLQGPVGVPQRAGHSHAIYNPGNVPLEWMNINFRYGPAAGGMPPGPGRGGPPALPSFGADPTATFNMVDDRAGAALDPVPVFQYTTLYRDTMRPASGLNGGKGNVLYERVVGPSTYLGNWAFVDHYVLSPGATLGRHVHAGVEEIYYVMNGEGTVAVGSETAPIRRWDAVPIHVKEVHSFENTGPQDLEFMVVGVALEKGKLDSENVK